MKFGSQLGFARQAAVSELLVSQVVNRRRKLTDDQMNYWIQLLDCSKHIFDYFPDKNANANSKPEKTTLKGDR